MGTAEKSQAHLDGYATLLPLNGHSVPALPRRLDGRNDTHPCHPLRSLKTTGAGGGADASTHVAWGAATVGRGSVGRRSERYGKRGSPPTAFAQPDRSIDRYKYSIPMPQCGIEKQQF